MRFLPILLCLLMAVPCCRHRRHLPTEGVFTSAGYRFVPQDARSHQLSRNEKNGELIGVIRSTGIPVRVLPIRLGSYSRYTLQLTAEGGERGTAGLGGRSKNRFAVVSKNGAVHAGIEPPETLPEDWVCILSMEGNICLMAWNRKTGGANSKFYAKGAKKKDAVYKVLELDDPRYHHDGVPLKELRD